MDEGARVRQDRGDGFRVVRDRSLDFLSATIVLVRTFHAPRRLVWEAMFTPDKMRRWMLPPPG